MSRSRAAGRRTDVWRLAVGAVLVAIALGVRSGSPAPSSAASSSSSASSACPSIPPQAADATEHGWNRHVDQTLGFSIDYPGEWQPYQSADSGVAFLAGLNSCDSLEIRFFAGLAVTFDPSQTQAMKVVSDSVLSAEHSITVGSVVQVSVDGLPGWQYIYTFPDSHSGAVGAHVHIFLFSGNRIITIVFQAIPADDLRKLAQVFDIILKSVRVAVPPAASPTASPGAAVPSRTPAASAAPPTATPSP